MSPRSPESLGRIRDESRDLIMESALELFTERGFMGTSVRALAEHAGVSQGLLYNYFDGKHGLLRAIFDRGTREVAATFEEAESATPSESLAVLVRAAFHAVRRNPRFWRLTYQLRMQPDVLAGQAPEILSRAKDIRQRIETLLQGLSGGAAPIRATVLFAAIDGAAQHFVLDPDGYPLDDVATEVIATLVPNGGDHPPTTEGSS